MVIRYQKKKQFHSWWFDTKKRTDYTHGDPMSNQEPITLMVIRCQKPKPQTNIGVASGGFFPQKCHFLESTKWLFSNFWQCLGKFLLSFRYVLDMF